ncbi:MAG: MBL fold metallo-hydrolase [Bacilli bacterium]|nr:MBL fold metallo-hydrolase [Bacilli bacterium]
MKIDVNKQSSIRITGSKILYFDPLEWNYKHDADYIFITHSHFDHFSLLSILELKKDSTVIVTPKDIVEELLSIGIGEEYILVVSPNQKIVLKNLEIRTIPAYNLHKKHHPKDKGWVGYLVDFDGVTYYIAGDSDVTSSAKEVKCDVAFLPVGGTYTMDCLEAASLCNLIHPKLAIPIHYGYVVGSIKDAEIFKKRLDKDIECKIFMKGEQQD